MKITGAFPLDSRYVAFLPAMMLVARSHRDVCIVAFRVLENKVGVRVVHLVVVANSSGFICRHGLKVATSEPSDGHERKVGVVGYIDVL